MQCAYGPRYNINYLIVGGIIWGLVWLVLTLTLPPLPIDETRYLSVAWGMRETGDWLLPRINGAPYSHKPPLLFWLINIFWTLGGSDIWVARIIPGLVSLGVFLMTGKIAKSLYPDNPAVMSRAPLLLMTMPAFMLYGALIMFDMLMALWVMVGIYALWRAANTGTWRYWGLYTLALGLGLLSKGPVVLIHLLPVALAFPLWRPAGSLIPFKKWYGTLACAVLGGAAIILAWAIPAAIVGGDEFARMIFWEQSAGRMVKAFDHARPIWFYIPVLLVFFLPLFFLTPFWGAVKNITRRNLPRASVFILCWTIPALISFFLMSGKQPHYLLPLLPGFAILLSGAMVESVSALKKSTVTLSIGLMFIFIPLAVFPQIPSLHLSNDRVIGKGLADFNSLLYVAAAIAVPFIFFMMRGSLNKQILGIIACVSLFFMLLSVEAERSFYHFYDLRPLGAAMQPYKQSPLAYVYKYEAQLGFVARLEHPIDSIEMNDLPAWFVQNPDGYAVITHRTTKEIADFKLIYTMPYKANKFLSLVEQNKE